MVKYLIFVYVMSEDLYFKIADAHDHFPDLINLYVTDDLKPVVQIQNRDCTASAHCFNVVDKANKLFGVSNHIVRDKDMVFDVNSRNSFCN